MGKKTIIISEKQLNEINGSDSIYFDAAHKDFREFSGQNEVMIGGKDSLNKKDPSPTVSDRVADEMGRTDNWFTISRAKTLGVPNPIFCSHRHKNNNIISESNSDLEGEKFTIDPTTMKALQATLNGLGNSSEKGTTRLRNIVKNGNVSYTEATTLKSLLDKMSPDTAEYNNMGGKPLHDFLNKTLDNKTSIIKRGKEMMKDLGFSNQFQKAGGMKKSGNGMAHTKKNVTYFEAQELMGNIIEESRSIKSQKLLSLLNQHGGFRTEWHGQHKKYPNTNADLHTIDDNDVIGVFDYGEENKAKTIAKDKYNFQPGDDIDFIRLEDMTYLAVIVRNAFQYPSRSNEHGGFNAYMKKRRERENQHPINYYKWNSETAQEVFHNPWYKDWSPESKEWARNKIKSEYNKSK